MSQFTAARFSFRINNVFPIVTFAFFFRAALLNLLKSSLSPYIWKIIDNFEESVQSGRHM